MLPDGAAHAPVMVTGELVQDGGRRVRVSRYLTAHLGRMIRAVLDQPGGVGASRCCSAARSATVTRR